MVLGCLFSESLQKTYYSSVCLSVLPSIYLPFYMCECAPSACLVPMEVRSVCCSLGTGVLGSRKQPCGYQTQVLLDTGQCWSILFWTYILFKNLFWEAIPFQHAMQLLINPTAGHARLLCILTQKHGFLPFCFFPHWEQDLSMQVCLSSNSEILLPQSCCFSFNFNKIVLKLKKKKKLSWIIKMSDSNHNTMENSQHHYSIKG